MTDNREPGTLNSPPQYHSKCPVCTSEKIRDKYQVNGYAIAECLTCTALFVKEELTSGFLANYYQQLEGDFAYEPDNRQYVEYYYAELKQEIEALKPGKGKILDVGCSAGYFLALMTGWEKHGIEISADYGAKARAALGRDVFIGSFADYPVRNEYFDVITLQDVFDHFSDPYESLRKCSALLKSDGLIVIKVHNIACLYARLSGDRFYALIPPSHLYYFNQKSLRAILARCGFDVLRAKFIGQVLQLKMLFYRLARGEPGSVFYRIYLLLNRGALGRIAIYKNLHDIITIFAVKGKVPCAEK
jgi:SAM-dependent methyltransferase